MAKKNSLSLSFESFTPVASIIVFVSILVFVFQKISGTFLLMFFAPGKLGSVVAFSPTKITEYFRFILHVFGSKDFVLLSTNCLIFMFLSSKVEQDYGSVFTLIMCFVATFVTGIINACFFTQLCYGLEGLIFMFFVLTVFSAQNRKNLSVFLLFALTLYVLQAVVLIVDKKQYSLIAQFIGGLCGYFVSFAAFTPKRKTAKKTSPKSQEQK